VTADRSVAVLNDFTAARGDTRWRTERGRTHEPEVIVAILGPVEVRGAAHPFRRAPALDLVVYLALHHRGASNDAWATALWPDRLMAAPTLHSTASAARRALGASTFGHDHLPRSHGRLQLAPTVGTDYQELRSLSAREDPTAWRSALDLVRGRPFDGLRNGDWAVLEGVLSAVEEGVVDLALRLAHHELAAGSGRGAARAARAGLLASPYDERLYRILLRAADLEGNPAGVERVMAELLQVVDGAGAGRGPRQSGAFDLRVVHPETATLYRSLSRWGAEGSRAVVGRH
jgi:DNA-binding SARP family transcriptional activator